MRQVRLPLYPAPRIVGDCDGEPGLCVVFSCADNVTLRVTKAGSIHVPGTDVYLPCSRTSEGSVAEAVRALCSADDDPLTDAVLHRAAWLEQRYGSNCWRDLRRVLVDASQQAIGELWGVRQQAVSLWESNARAAIIGEADE